MNCVEPTTAVPVGTRVYTGPLDFDALARNHGKRLRNFIRKRVWNHDEVEDLLQATFLEALRCQDKFQGCSRPETWLFGIALNLVRNHARRAIQYQRHYRMSELIEDCVVSDVDDPSDIVMRQSLLEAVRLGFETLPNDMRQTVRLVVEQGASYQQAATELGIPVGTVRSRLSRARQQLRVYVGMDNHAEQGPAAPTKACASTGVDAARYRFTPEDDLR